MPTREDDGTPEVTGPLLRQARKRQQLTLAVAADRVGLSVTHLSRLENGQRQPSIGVLMQLARLYGVGVGELLGEPTEASHHLTRAVERHERQGPDGEFATLTGLPNLRALQVVTLSLGDGDEHRSSTHQDEELLYVVQGEVRLTLGDRQIDMSQADAIHFDARVEHSLHAKVGGTRVLVICTPLQLPNLNAHVDSGR